MALRTHTPGQCQLPGGSGRTLQPVNAWSITKKGRVSHTSTKKLLALVVCPESADRVAHLSHPGPGNAIKKSSNALTPITPSVWRLQLSAVARTCSPHRLLQGLYHPLIPGRLEPDFGEIERAANNITSLTTVSTRVRIWDDYWVMDAAMVAATPDDHVMDGHSCHAYNQHIPPSQNG